MEMEATSRIFSKRNLGITCVEEGSSDTKKNGSFAILETLNEHNIHEEIIRDTHGGLKIRNLHWGIISTLWKRRNESGRRTTKVPRKTSRIENTYEILRMFDHSSHAKDTQKKNAAVVKISKPREAARLFGESIFRM